MTKHAFNKWLLVMAATAIGFGCQPKNSSTSSKKAPIEQPSCQPSVSNPGGSCEQNCREDECDEQEAGEEAMTHVIEVDDFEESSSASAKEAPQAAPEAPAQEAVKAPSQEPIQASVEAPADMVQESSTASSTLEESLSALDAPTTDSGSETAVQD